MATTKKIGSAPVEAAALPEAVPFHQRTPLHKAFQWSDPLVCNVIPAHSPIAFVNMTRDITMGAVAALGIIERCQLAANCHDDDERPMLSQTDQSGLMRLTIGSLQALNAKAESLNEWVDEHGPDWGASERAESAKGGQ